MTGNEHTAEDALQEAYLKAFRALTKGSYDGRAKVSTWLHRVVTNTCIDLLRKKKPEATVESDTLESSSSAGPQAQHEARAALRALNKMLGNLTAEQRAVLVLRTVEGRSIKETAEILECTPGAVEQRLIRARTALQSQIAKNAEGTI